MHRSACTARLAAGTTLVLLAALTALPVVHAGTSLAWSQDGQCVLVDDAVSPPSAALATGCDDGLPCVYVNWTTTPPSVAVGTSC